jgi:copper resistance protein B
MHWAVVEPSGRVKQDIRPTPARTHAMIGFEACALSLRCAGLAYLSDKGNSPPASKVRWTRGSRVGWSCNRARNNFAGPTCLPNGSGRGSGARMGLRLRYEIDRRFAPYVGYSWDWATGRTADYRRADGDRGEPRGRDRGQGWF